MNPYFVYSTIVWGIHMFCVGNYISYTHTILDDYGWSIMLLTTLQCLWMVKNKMIFNNNTSVMVETLISKINY